MTACKFCGMDGLRWVKDEQDHWQLIEQRALAGFISVPGGQWARHTIHLWHWPLCAKKDEIPLREKDPAAHIPEGARVQW